MNGRRAKILRREARRLTSRQPYRQQEVVDLPPRWKWVDVPDDSGNLLKRLRNRFLHALGIPVPMKRERVEIIPQVIREKKGTTRWVYKRLKRIYYRLRWT